MSQFIELIVSPDNDEVINNFVKLKKYSNLQIPDMFFNWQKNQLKVVFEFKMRL